MRGKYRSTFISASSLRLCASALNVPTLASPPSSGCGYRFERAGDGGDVGRARAAAAADDAHPLGGVGAGVLGELLGRQVVLPAPDPHVVAPVVRVDAER